MDTAHPVSQALELTQSSSGALRQQREHLPGSRENICPLHWDKPEGLLSAYTREAAEDPDVSASVSESMIQ